MSCGLDLGLNAKYVCLFPSVVWSIFIYPVLGSFDRILMISWH